jgi:hypothetical protein
MRDRALSFVAAVSFVVSAVQAAPNGLRLAEPPEPSRLPHPEPRVIVNVLAVRGPHKPARVQHDARFGWKRIVRCYKKTNGAQGKSTLTLEFEISGEGSITGARSILVEPKDRELASCLAADLTGLAMPKAPANSTAAIEFLLSPGDRSPKK